MITKEELKTVNTLYEELRKLKSIRNDFDSPYVHASIGIVDINSASPNKTKPSKNADFFYNNFKEETKELNIILKGMIERSILKKEVDISKYIHEGEIIVKNS